jgi:S-adenosylmethionine-diacylglycerol 3-amino-3-carboxypropyl transferase
VGARPASREERLALYERVREALPAAARARWDARPEEVAYGVQQVGRFEALFRELAATFREAGLDPLARPAEAIASPRWREIFERVFEREKLAAVFGRAAVAYSMDRSFGAHFADVFARALERGWGGENYFLRQVWEDRYGAALPEWLREPGRIRGREE